MRQPIAAIFFAAGLISVSSGSAQQIFPLDDLQPGMTATAITVYQGNALENIQLEIVDILRNFYPKRNLIIAKLMGKRAEFYGAAAGMSGSPVYIDDKIVGAISYSLGSFLREPLMGVTPIGEMLEILEKEKHRGLEMAASSDALRLQKFVDAALGIAPPLWELFVPAVRADARTAGAIRPLPIALQMSGFTDSAVAFAEQYLGPLGFQPARGGSSGAGEEGGELVPGAPIAAVLLHGDFDLAATGTVTYRDGDLVLGFGHPFFDNGPVSLPMAQAKILTTISSDLGSQKLGLTGKIVGTLRQDRTTGIMGVIGPLPDMTRVVVNYHSEEGELTRFAFSLTQDRSIASLQPLILRVAMISALESARLSTGENSLRLAGSVRLKDGSEISLDNLYPGYQPLPVFSFLNSILHSTGQVAATLAAITNNPFKDVAIDQINLDFTSVQGRLSAELENVWLDQTSFEPGDTLVLRYRIRPYHGDAVIAATKIVIPASIDARSLSIVVGGGPAVSAYEKRRMPTKFTASSFPSLINLLKGTRRNDVLVVQVRQLDRGAIVDGEELPALPPSVRPVINNSGTRNRTFATRDRVVFERSVPQPLMIDGIRVLQIRRAE